MSEQKSKLLKLMRFWLVGTFVVVFVAITAYVAKQAYALTNQYDWVGALKAGLPIWGITAVLCIIWYLGYAYWLKRRPD